MSDLSNRLPLGFIHDTEDPEFDPPACLTSPDLPSRDPEHMDALQVAFAVMGIVAVVFTIWVIGPTISALVIGANQ